MLYIDSITAVALGMEDRHKIRTFIFELGENLATLGVTTFLIRELYEQGKMSAFNVEESISDAIIKFEQIKMLEEFQRIIQIIKLRGGGYRTGDIYFRISEHGINVIPTYAIPLEYTSTTKISTGNDVLDKMLFGVIFAASYIHFPAPAYPLCWLILPFAHS